MSSTFTLDSRATLGLLAKSYELFAETDVTLSFPLGAPVSFDVAEFADAMGPAPDARAHARLAEFSTMMNWIPDGIVWPPAAPRRLDEVVRYIVEQADWAVGSSTPEEEARKAAARAIVDMANPVMQQYLTLRDAWIRAKQELRNRADDPAAVEAEARAHVAMLSYPHRDAIEQAQQELITLDERAPFRARERMQRQIDVGVGTFDDPSGGRFSPARPLPKDVIQAASWSSVSLDRAALEQLATDAPPELRDHLEVGEGDDDIVSVSFEYASAQLHRQWLDAALFALRCWRFPGDGRMLSDGATPPAGDCPSYVRALVFARNVRVTRHAPPAGEKSSGGEGGFPILIPPAEQIEQSEIVLDRTLEWEDPLYVLPPEVVDPIVVVEPQPEPEPDRIAHETVLVDRNPDLQILMGSVADRSVRAHDLVLGGELLQDAVALRYSDRMVVAEPAVHVAVESPARWAVPARTLRRRDRHWKPYAIDPLLVEASAAPDFPMLLDPSLIVTAGPSPADADTDAELVTTSSPDGQIILLTLICKSLGRSPDPDPAYGWA